MISLLFTIFLFQNFGKQLGYSNNPVLCFVVAITKAQTHWKNVYKRWRKGLEKAYQLILPVQVSYTLNLNAIANGVYSGVLNSLSEATEYLSNCPQPLLSVFAVV